MNHVLSSGEQGERKQDRVLAGVGVAKKLVTQDCGTVCLVAYIGLGQTGTDLV